MRWAASKIFIRIESIARRTSWDKGVREKGENKKKKSDTKMDAFE